MKPVRPVTVTMGVVAILFGLATTYGARRLLEPKPAPAAQPEAAKPMATVVVAQTNLGHNARIHDQDVAAVEVPVGRVPEKAMTVKARAVGRLVKANILAGSPVREEDLYQLGEVPLLADQLPAGYRAVTLKVDDANTANGVIQPGLFVDVSLTFNSDHPDVAGMATVSLMRRLKVLTPGPSASEPSRQIARADKTERYITVAATSEQANQLILAQNYGTVAVTLCSTAEGDASVEKDRGLVNTYQLLGLSRPLAPIPEEAPKEAPRRTVEVYRGTEVQKVVFNAAGDMITSEPARALASAGGGGSQGVGAKAAGAASSAVGAAISQQRKPCPTCNKKKIPTLKTTAATGPTAAVAASPVAEAAQSMESNPSR